MEKINLTREMMEKAKEAKTVEELLLLAREKGIGLTDERAAIYFEKINPKIGQLEDEELDNVSGGACEYKERVCKCGSNKFIVSTRMGDMGEVKEYTCEECGRYYPF